MQILITHGRLASTRVLNFGSAQIGLALAALAFVLMMLSGTIYHFVFLKAARDGWPVVSQVVRLVVRDEIVQRERYMRENLDAMAQKVGEMQAKLVRLELMSERVGGLAGLKAEDLILLQAVPEDGKGGPFVPAPRPSLEELQRTVAGLDQAADRQSDLFIFSESRLLQTKLQSMRVPSTAPVNGPVGSGFGFRSDPITGRAALHTGLDFPAEPGTPLSASAAGVVLSTAFHPEYGRLVEIDHGNGLLTRYAHCLKVHVQPGQLVRRGEVIAEVGSSGRSTGPHLHFEVLVDGVPQDPARFLATAAAPVPGPTARR